MEELRPEVQGADSDLWKTDDRPSAGCSTCCPGSSWCCPKWPERSVSRDRRIHLSPVLIRWDLLDKRGAWSMSAKSSSSSSDRESASSLVSLSSSLLVYWWPSSSLLSEDWIRSLSQASATPISYSTSSSSAEFGDCDLHVGCLMGLRGKKVKAPKKVTLHYKKLIFKRVKKTLQQNPYKYCTALVTMHPAHYTFFFFFFWNIVQFFCNYFQQMRTWETIYAAFVWDLKITMKYSSWCT